MIKPERLPGEKIVDYNKRVRAYIREQFGEVTGEPRDDCKNFIYSTGIGRHNGCKICTAMDCRTRVCYWYDRYDEL